MHTTSRRTNPLAKALPRVALLVYAALVAYIVFFARRRHGLVWTPSMVNLVPLLGTIHDHDYLKDIGRWNYWDNIFGNIALFVPLPALVASASGLCSRRWLLGLGMAVSVAIECAQYVWEVGIPDIDDVIFNSTGVLLGLLLWELVLRKIHRRLAY